MNNLLCPRCGGGKAYLENACWPCRQVILAHADWVLSLKECGCATAACEHGGPFTSTEAPAPVLVPFDFDVLAAYVLLLPREVYDRAPWDIDPTFTARMGTLAR